MTFVWDMCRALVISIALMIATLPAFQDLSPLAYRDSPALETVSPCTSYQIYSPYEMGFAACGPRLPVLISRPDY